MNQLTSPQLLLFSQRPAASEKYLNNLMHSDWTTRLVDDSLSFNLQVLTKQWALILIVCDTELGEFLAVIRQVRSESNVLIMAICDTANSLERAQCIEAGADDVLPVSASKREIQAMVSARLERLPEPKLISDRFSPIDINGVKLEPGTRQVSCNQTLISLTGKEFDILHLLMLHSGEVVSKQYLCEKVLKYQLTPYSRGIDVHICNIRRKLAAANNHDVLNTIRGVGYVFLSIPRQASVQAQYKRPAKQRLSA